ncbi:hypothetical protein Z949_4115 [Sulfitobacter guttiformis KCTC 32187]|nr:hypothetical protein Z949_4115 [Sulfitobacter guttiformis KCTC 32187]
MGMPVKCAPQFTPDTGPLFAFLSRRAAVCQAIANKKSHDNTLPDRLHINVASTQRG